MPPISLDMSNSSTFPVPHCNTPSNEAETPRPQADPLPSKRGEIGYVEAAETPTENSHDINSNAFIPPVRHPADRDYSLASRNAVVAPSQSEVVSQSSSAQPSPTASITKSYGILDFFKPERSPAFRGLRLITLLIFATQIIFLGGTVTAWGFVSDHLAHLMSEGQNLFAGRPTIILVHVIFFILVLVQLVFLERRFYRLRGERYRYLHPGELLPRYGSNIPQTSTTLAFAPWNRPPLPTYAAALAQSGVGTGDVEDHLIAASPPPAYGNTRGSTLLLSGLLRNSLRAQHHQLDSSPVVQESDTDRPLSYVSRDEQRDEVQNAERARRLEETLSRLEQPSAAHIVGS